MVCSDEDEFSYEGSYFEEVVELSEEEDDDDEDDDENNDNNQVDKITTTPPLNNLLILADKQPCTPKRVGSVGIEPQDEFESHAEDDDDVEYIIEEEFIEENYEVALAGSESEDPGEEDETSFDDNSTAYNPDDDAPIITAEPPSHHRQSDSTEMEIGKYSDHSMDTGHAFELNLPFTPKSKQMSAVTLDWDFHQDSGSSWGDWGSDEDYEEGTIDLGKGEQSSTGPIIYMEARMQETERGTPNDGPKRGVARNKSNGKLGRRPSLQRTPSGGFQSRGSLSRNNSGNLRGAMDRTHSGGLVRPMPSSLVSGGMPRRKSHGHLIMSPLDTLAEEVNVKEDGGTQLSPVANPEDHPTKLSRETLLGSSDSNQLAVPPPPPTDSDSSSSSQGSGDDGDDDLQKSPIQKNTKSTPPNEERGPDKCTEVTHTRANDDAPPNVQLSASQQQDDEMRNLTLDDEMQSITMKDTDLPTDSSTNATTTMNIENGGRTLKDGTPPDTVPDDLTSDNTFSNNGTGALERLSKDGTTISTPDEVDSLPRVSVTSTLGSGSFGCDKPKEDDGATRTTDGLANTTKRTSSIKVRAGSISKIQAPPPTTNENGTQNPVTPSPSRPIRKSRSIDQLRRSNHLNIPRVGHDSQTSLQRRASKRSVNGSPGITSEASASPKTGKVSRFEQLLKRSTAIKAVR